MRHKPAKCCRIPHARCKCERARLLKPLAHLPWNMRIRAKRHKFAAQLHKTGEHIYSPRRIIPPGCRVHLQALALLRRVGLGDIKTCAAGAADLLGKGEGF